MVGGIGGPAADMDDLVFGEGQGRGVGAPPEDERVVVVGHFEVVGVGIVALELHRHLHRLAAADPHRPLDGESLAGAREAFPERPELRRECPGGIAGRIDGRRLLAADLSDPDGARQASGQKKRRAGRAGGDHGNLLGAGSGAGSGAD